MDASATSPISIDAQQVQEASAELTILGAGAWGTALAKLVRKNDHTVCLWSRRGETTLANAVSGSHIILSAISMKGVSATVKQLQELNIPPETILVTATKGLDPETTRTPSQIFQDTFPDNPVVVLSGPNLSKEIEQGLPAATVAASTHPEAAEAVQYLFASDIFRVYRSLDPLGAELGGTLKNVIAIAVGVCEGLNLGSNARSALITRAMPEVIRIGTHLGGQMDTFFGLSGLGDMLATCTSSLSRNYRVGYGLAHGKPLDQILDELGSTAEGVNTANVLIQIANREEIPVPISREVYRLLNGKITPKEAVEALMERDLKAEACLLN
ncbi:NAD(P)H-dependent glycerol-3-phosphate dehydrogenase [Oscillatoria sp. CS-180]|uniref:NAD(P)H-dependent glycerol-3-phosphate dehydrogenase n=1 Tax=Oscillatoria sp. CS-180 TaxID=3021720 RepID=UPI00232D1BD4|nr:NAD(P)H-dependent glycerol-3-phosphate dehydrogenase [Oscillatoria sp. CS-180]MDB9524689.1 NAD(P)H-dependent glycerol-3-phosphate dehydrogenase [Oscillatoria sp. CS-180]